MTFNFGHKCTTNENNANHLKSMFNKEKLKSLELFLLLNMDFKWLALFSFVV